MTICKLSVEQVGPKKVGLKVGRNFSHLPKITIENKEFENLVGNKIVGQKPKIRKRWAHFVKTSSFYLARFFP